MKRIAELVLEDGTSVLVEVDEPEGRIREAARDGEDAAPTKIPFTALNAIRPFAEYARGLFRQLPDAPNEVSVQFGVKISAKFGVLIASGNAETNFAVTLKWAN